MRRVNNSVTTAYSFFALEHVRPGRHVSLLLCVLRPFSENLGTRGNRLRALTTSSLGLRRHTGPFSYSGRVFKTPNASFWAHCSRPRCLLEGGVGDSRKCAVRDVLDLGDMIIRQEN